MDSVVTNCRFNW